MRFLFTLTLLSLASSLAIAASDHYDAEAFYDAVKNSGPRELSLVGKSCNNEEFFAAVKDHAQNFNELKQIQNKLARLELEEKGIVTALEKITRKPADEKADAELTARIEDLFEASVRSYAVDLFMIDHADANGGNLDPGYCDATSFAESLATNEKFASPLALAYVSDDTLVISVIPSMGTFNKTMTPEQVAKNSYFSAGPIFTNVHEPKFFLGNLEYMAKIQGMRIRLKASYVDAAVTAKAFANLFNAHQLLARREKLEPVLLETRNEIARLEPLAAVPNEVLESSAVFRFILQKTAAKWDK